jgi:hypothetical protein
MKIRTGFISNSSSSSFIVVFDKKPKNAKEICKILFGNLKHIAAPYDNREIYDSMKIARVVWNDIAKKESLSIQDIQEVLLSGWIEKHMPFCKDYPDSSTLELEKEWAKKTAEKIKESYKDNFIFNVGYSDNDGPFYSTMEHGDIFHLAKQCIQISQH